MRTIDLDLVQLLTEDEAELNGQIVTVIGDYVSITSSDPKVKFRVRRWQQQPLHVLEYESREPGATERINCYHVLSDQPVDKLQELIDKSVIVLRRSPIQLPDDNDPDGSYLQVLKDDSNRLSIGQLL